MGVAGLLKEETEGSSLSSSNAKHCEDVQIRF